MLRVLKAKYLTIISALKTMNGFNKCPGGMLMFEERSLKAWNFLK
jgi:hypothetical protein